MVYSFLYLCRSDGMADVTDSKSVGSDTVWVRVPPSAPRRSKVRFAPASFFCLRQKKTPSARSLAPPFQLRPALLARSWQAALRAAFFSNRRSRGSRSFLARGAVRFAPASFFCLRQKKTPSARSLAPPFQLRPALLARSWQAALRAAFFSNRRSQGFPRSFQARGTVRFAPASFFCLRQKRRHPHAPLLLLSNCDPLCWLAVGMPPCGRHSFPIGGPGGPPFLPGQRDRLLCSGVFFLPAAKKTPSARSLAPPFQLRPALLARSWQAALRAAFFSNRRSRVSPFLPGRGAVRFAPIFLSPAKNAIRTPGRQSSAAVSVYHISFALSRQGRRCAHFHSP